MKNKYFIFLLAFLILVLIFNSNIAGFLGKDDKEYKCPDCNVILVVVDTLRANHLGVYGYHRNTSPNIDSLAEKSLVFENSYSASSWTRPAIASILSSKLPIEHGIYSENGDERLDGNFFTMQEFFNKKNYSTAAFYTNPHLKFGLVQNFISTYYKGNGAANIVYEKAIDWIKKNSSNNFFMLIHNNDPHDAYEFHGGLNFSQKNSKYRKAELFFPLGHDDLPLREKLRSFNVRKNRAEGLLEGQGDYIPVGIDVFVEEEKSLDSKTGHTGESVGYLIFGDTGAINGYDGVKGEIGSVSVKQKNSGTWHTVNLNKSYNNPVVVMKPVSYNGNYPSHVRLKNVTSSSFEFQIEEWQYLDGEYITETISYLVMESGVHTLEDGTKVEVGTVSTDHNFESVSFSQSFTSPPVVISQSQTFNGPHPIVTRQKSISSSGFEVRVQEEEGNDGQHVLEKIGYIAIQQSSGSNGGKAYEVGKTSSTVTGSWHPISFSNNYSSDPVFIADMQTFNGDDTAELRYQNIGKTYLNKTQLSEMKANYDGEIAFTDHHLGRLIDYLRETHLDERTIIIITADHGEEFLDHGGYWHGFTLYNELLRVPLVVYLPNSDKGSFKQKVGTVDIFPTLVDIFDEDNLSKYDFAGQTLLPLVENKEWEEEPIFSATAFRGPLKYSLIDGNNKIIRYADGEVIGVYNLKEDPSELENLKNDSSLLGYLNNSLSEIIESKRDGWESGKEETEVEKETLEQLKGLGYMT